MARRIELKIDDSLRRMIDQGIRSSKFAAVIFSASFFAKGWTQYELDGIVTMTVAGEQSVLPIWHNVTRDDVIDHSPCLETVDCIGFARDEFEAAMNWLTLRASDLCGEPLEHWELDRRAVRLATRPFVEISQGRVLLCPWGASTTRTIVGNHLMDGRLPWPQSALPDAVNEALTAYRSSRNVDLERQVIAALKEYPHLRVRGPIKKAKVLGLKILPREIDSICVDEARSRIWVIEAKDRAVAFSPQQLRTAIDQFHEENGYIHKVVANVAIIDNNASTVAAAMGALNPDRTWQVIGLMATRRIEPAAYVGEPRLVFCTADTVVQTIDCNTVPHGRYELASAGLV